MFLGFMFGVHSDMLVFITHKIPQKNIVTKIISISNIHSTNPTQQIATIRDSIETADVET